MLNRTFAPALEEISTVPLPPVEVTSFANGSRLHTISNKTQPIFKLEIVLKAGKWYEPSGGVSYLTAKMLLEGTQSYSAKQIADIIGFYGTSLDVNHSFDRTSITLYSLTKHFNPLVELVAALLFSPAFSEKEFELLKIRTIQNISVEKKKNSYLANQLFTRNFYGITHPYNTGINEVLLNQISITEVKDFYTSNYNLAEAEIFISGDYNPEHLATIEHLFGNTVDKNTSKVALQDYKLASIVQKYFLNKEDSLQSSVRVGGAWPSMNHPDYHKLSLLNKILGGYFGSRLMKNIREDKGFTYGIYSTISVKERHNLFYIGTDVNYQSTQQTLKEIYYEIDLLKKELISSAELETVKNYSLGKLANDLSTTFDQSEKYKTIVLHNLPLTFYTDYISTVKQLQPKELMLLANNYYKTEDLFEVVVGKPQD